MLTPEQRAAGWREHDGGPCPVPLSSMPKVLLRCGFVGWVSGTNERWNWNYKQAPELGLDIIAYLPETSHDQ